MTRLRPYRRRVTSQLKANKYFRAGYCDGFDILQFKLIGGMEELDRGHGFRPVIMGLARAGSVNYLLKTCQNTRTSTRSIKPIRLSLS